MNDLVIEALREKVAELTADVRFWNTAFLEAREGYEKELAAMTQSRDDHIDLTHMALDERDEYLRQLDAMTKDRDHYKEMDALHIQSLGLKIEQLAAMTKSRGDNWNNATENALRLAAAQARIKELREALERCESMFDYHYIGTTIAQDALATHDDSSALDAALKAERERCAKKCEHIASERFAEHGTYESDTGASYYGGRCEDEYNARDEEDESCAAAIRSMK